jgi:hypothetical protein
VFKDLGLSLHEIQLLLADRASAAEIVAAGVGRRIPNGATYDVFEVL